MFLDITIDRQPSTETITNVRESNIMPSKGVASVANVGAETWHSRLGHPNEAVLEATKKTEGLGVAYSTPPKSCVTCLKNKST